MQKRLSGGSSYSKGAWQRRSRFRGGEAGENNFTLHLGSNVLMLLTFFSSCYEKPCWGSNDTSALGYHTPTLVWQPCWWFWELSILLPSAEPPLRSMFWPSSSQQGSLLASLQTLKQPQFSCPVAGKRGESQALWVSQDNGWAAESIWTSKDKK